MIDDTLMTLGLLFLFAIVGGLIATRFKQPVIIGMLLVGTIIGPNALNLVKDGEMISLMIELGAILFLFFIGLEFSIKRLAILGPKVLLVTLFKVGLMFFVGYLTMIVMGFDVVTATFTGVAVSFSSTMIILNILKQYGFKSRKELPLLTGVLIIEDIFGVTMLTIFGLIKSSRISMFESFGKLILGLILLLAIYAVVTKYAEKIVSWITKNSGDEVFVFLSLALCAGFAALSSVLGLGGILGAFLAGSIISSLREAKTFEHATRPYLTIFNALFFISLGTMINFANILDELKVIIALFAFTAVGLVFAMGLSTRVFAGFSRESAAFSVMSMLPFGSFSLLVARQSVQFDAGVDLMTIVSLMIIIQAIVMSLTVKHSEWVTDHLPWSYTSRAGFIAGLSRYISNFMEHLRIEHTLTTRLKRKALKLSAKVTVLVLLTIFLTIFLLKLHERDISILLLIPSYILALALISVMSYICYNAGKDTSAVLFKVLGGIDGSWQALRTRAFVQYIGLAILLSLSAFYFPIVILLFALPKWATAFSFGMILLALWFALRAAFIMKFYPVMPRIRLSFAKPGLAANSRN